MFGTEIKILLTETGKTLASKIQLHQPDLANQESTSSSSSQSTNYPLSTLKGLLPYNYESIENNENDIRRAQKLAKATLIANNINDRIQRKTQLSIFDSNKFKNTKNTNDNIEKESHIWVNSLPSNDNKDNEVGVNINEEEYIKIFLDGKNKLNENMNYPVMCPIFKFGEEKDYVTVKSNAKFHDVNEVTGGGEVEKTCILVYEGIHTIDEFGMSADYDHDFINTEHAIVNCKVYEDEPYTEKIEICKKKMEIDDEKMEIDNEKKEIDDNKKENDDEKMEIGEEKMKIDEMCKVIGVENAGQCIKMEEKILDKETCKENDITNEQSITKNSATQHKPNEMVKTEGHETCLSIESKQNTINHVKVMFEVEIMKDNFLMTVKETKLIKEYTNRLRIRKKMQKTRKRNEIINCRKKNTSTNNKQSTYEGRELENGCTTSNNNKKKHKVTGKEEEFEEYSKNKESNNKKRHTDKKKKKEEEKKCIKNSLSKEKCEEEKMREIEGKKRKIINDEIQELRKKERRSRFEMNVTGKSECKEKEIKELQKKICELMDKMEIIKQEYNKSKRLEFNEKIRGLQNKEESKLKFIETKNTKRLSSNPNESFRNDEIDNPANSMISLESKNNQNLEADDKTNELKNNDSISKEKELDESKLIARKKREQIWIEKCRVIADERNRLKNLNMLK